MTGETWTARAKHAWIGDCRCAVPIAYSFNPSAAVPAAPASPLPDDNAAPPTDDRIHGFQQQGRIGLVRGENRTLSIGRGSI